MTTTAFDDQFAPDPSSFQREERYIVVKLKDLSDVQADILNELIDSWHIPERYCVVVESDWPIYEQTWDAVQRLAEGRPQRIVELEAERDQLRNELNGYKKGIRDEVAANNERCQQHLDYQDRLTAERDALAAHVERLKDAGEDLWETVLAVTPETRRWTRAVGNAPQASLAQRDAAMKAEALHSMAQESDGYVTADMLCNAADEYRQQVEGNE